MVHKRNTYVRLEPERRKTNVITTNINFKGEGRTNLNTTGYVRN